MLTASEPSSPRATAELISSLSVWHWIGETPEGPVAFLLLTHPGPSGDSTPASVDASMRSLSKALALDAGANPLPDVGRRLLVSQAGVLLRLDGADYLLHAPIAGPWSEFACRGGTVVLAVGLDPLTAHAATETVWAYLSVRARAGRVLLGKTRAFTRRSP